MSQTEKAEPPSIEVQFAADGQHCPSAPQIILWAQTALEKQVADLTIRIVESTEIQSLNEEFRAKSTPTNVLSFPSDIPPELGLAYLGDVAVCAEIVNSEALEQGKTNDSHWAHMIIHGVLHLRGFDHIQNTDADVMEALEIDLLADLGFNNPYEITNDNRVGNV